MSSGPPEVELLGGERSYGPSVFEVERTGWTRDKVLGKVKAVPAKECRIRAGNDT